MAAPGALQLGGEPDPLDSTAAQLGGRLAEPQVGEPDVTVARGLGRVMARLHQHAEGWKLPSGGSLLASTRPDGRTT